MTRGPTSRSPGDRRTSNGGLRSVGSTLQRVAGKTLRNLNSAEATLLTEWAAIAGEELAARARPRRLKFPRASERREGTLVLSVDPAFALDLQHGQDVLIERVNGFFGYRAVARILLEQRPLAQAPAPSPRVPPATALAPPARAGLLASRVDGIGDETLRLALLRLGTAVAARQAARGLKSK